MIFMDVHTVNTHQSLVFTQNGAFYLRIYLLTEYWYIYTNPFFPPFFLDSDEGGEGDRRRFFPDVLHS